MIVGAGSAGCVLASRLSEDPRRRVLLLEAGGDGLLEVVADPPRWPTLSGTERDWGYLTIPQPATGHVHEQPRGRGLGGSHSTNAMAFLRGHQSDFDSWAYAGNAGWGYDQVLPYFKRMERVDAGDPRYRGRTGPLRVGPTAHPHPLSLAFVEACLEAGHPARADFNGGELEGAGLHDMTIVDGRRQTAADAYLRPALRRPNLRLETGALVERVCLEHGRCTGVAYRQGGRLELARADREVILCAGAVDSPRLLLLSGIGDPDDLSRLGIDPLVALPGVGHNLQDHVLLRGLCVRGRSPIPAGTGNLGEAVLYWRSDPGLLGPDLQIVLIHVPFQNPWQEPLTNAFTFGVAYMRPLSRGRVTLASRRPDDGPLIDPRYLREEHDVGMLMQGIDKALELRAQPAFSRWRGDDAMSGVETGDHAAKAAFVRAAAGTFSHPVGTCRMGGDCLAVVDSQLAVHGVEGLRVADASVMPTITTTNTNAATIMIAEKAADLIRGRAIDATAARATAG